MNRASCVALMAIVASCASPSSMRDEDRFKALVIVDDAVTSDPRARNDADGPWSFRHAALRLSPNDPGALVLAWLNAWEPERVDEIDQRVTCPWLHRTASNACDPTCGACAHRELDLAAAPFRLVAIANRMDLGVKPDAL